VYSQTWFIIKILSEVMAKLGSSRFNSHIRNSALSCQRYICGEEREISQSKYRPRKRDDAFVMDRFSFPACCGCARQAFWVMFESVSHLRHFSFGSPALSLTLGVLSSTDSAKSWHFSMVMFIRLRACRKAMRACMHLRCSYSYLQRWTTTTTTTTTAVCQ
jgi:hypothetical protein